MIRVDDVGPRTALVFIGAVFLGPCFAGPIGLLVGLAAVPTGWVVGVVLYLALVIGAPLLYYRAAQRRFRAQFPRYTIGENQSWE